MLSLKRPAILILAAALVAVAQPALTPIQDTLYRADGSRFTGTVYITWNSFQGGTGANIATSNLTLPIVNGVLKVQLVPTTTASAGAQYNAALSVDPENESAEKGFYEMDKALSYVLAADDYVLPGFFEKS